MRLKINSWLLPLLLIGTLLLSGCAGSGGAPGSTATTSTSTPTTTAASPASPPAATAAEAPQLVGEATVEMVVKGSTITIELDGNNAPVTAGNFVDLVNQGVYDGLAFHRVVREPEPFVVQGGDPQSSDPSFPADQLGTGGFIDPATNEPRYIPLEIKPEGAQTPIYSQTLEESGVTQPPALKHTRGAVAMARSQFPDSASSQFYFALADLSFLDGSYAVFGYVTEGMDVVDQIQQGDRIESATVTAGLENLQGGSEGGS